MTVETQSHLNEIHFLKGNPVVRSDKELPRTALILFMRLLIRSRSTGRDRSIALVISQCAFRFVETTHVLCLGQLSGHVCVDVCMDCMCAIVRVR